MAGFENITIGIGNMTHISNVTENVVNTSDSLDDLSNEDSDASGETVRLIHVIGRPILIVFGTIGNLLAFYVMRRGSLKNVSTCFYMAVLGIADTGIIQFTLKAKLSGCASLLSALVFPLIIHSAVLFIFCNPVFHELDHLTLFTIFCW